MKKYKVQISAAVSVFITAFVLMMLMWFIQGLSLPKANVELLSLSGYIATCWIVLIVVLIHTLSTLTILKFWGKK